jgi:hypothetical protein
MLDKAISTIRMVTTNVGVMFQFQLQLAYNIKEPLLFKCKTQWSDYTHKNLGKRFESTKNINKNLDDRHFSCATKPQRT